MASTIEKLPEALRMELAINLKAAGWADYDNWWEWLTARLAEEGLEVSVSRSALGRWGRKKKLRFEQAMAAAEETDALAKVLVANKTDDGAVLKANELLASNALLEIQLALAEVREDLEDMEKGADATALTLELAKVQAKIMKGVADLNAAGIKRADWQAKLDEKLKAASETAQAAAKAAGASDATIDRIREALERGF